MNEAGQTQMLVRLASQSVDRVHLPDIHVRITHHAPYRENGPASAAAGRETGGEWEVRGHGHFSRELWGV
ncbi:MAG: hypothetical protein AB7I01_20985 [Gammaproteobacteria bacterium]